MVASVVLTSSVNVHSPITALFTLTKVDSQDAAAETVASVSSRASVRGKRRHAVPPRARGIDCADIHSRTTP